MNTPPLPRDVLFEVEREIARRADELDRQFGIDPTHALEHWRQAEAEIWRDAGVAEHAQPLMAG
jgi:hypothetical protein